MKIGLDLNLHPSPADRVRLLHLQTLFAQACNLVAPVVQQNRCWNRVTLHHLTYRTVRATYPDLGSQLACNAIYAVCRASRLVYQGPSSPFNVKRLANRPLPLLKFTPSAPVYLDRHTLTIRGGDASIFTPDGRVHCPVDITPQQAAHVRDGRVEEIALTAEADRLRLDFRIETDMPTAAEARRRKMPGSLSEHVLVHSESIVPTPAPSTASGPGESA